ncbi:glutathione S-transferase [Mycena maculata]|uniref:glutathione transferase n=1 Tax=Mycena maculata TaxID=230809 RepID=A0AAD7NVF4_9AGAR|nr:glutathione S-transferase [Mycena maculata]
MVLKLYAGPRAGGGGGVVAQVLLEKQIPFEHILVDLGKGEHKTAEFLEKHPFGQVPVIDDDGFILYESRAIARYLAEKYAGQGTPLIPTDLKGRALFEQAASVEFADFNPPLLRILTEKFRKPSGQPVDEVAVAEAVAQLSATLQVYEGILGKQKFLAGNEITIVDMFHLAYAPILRVEGIDVMTSTGPNTARWWNDVLTRPTRVKLKEEGIKSTHV